jgi:hypothetical protein
MRPNAGMPSFGTMFAYVWGDWSLMAKVGAIYQVLIQLRRPLFFLM